MHDWRAHARRHPELVGALHFNWNKICAWDRKCFGFLCTASSKWEGNGLWVCKFANWGTLGTTSFISRDQNGTKSYDLQKLNVWMEKPNVSSPTIYSSNNKATRSWQHYDLIIMLILELGGTIKAYNMRLTCCIVHRLQIIPKILQILLTALQITIKTIV